MIVVIRLFAWLKGAKWVVECGVLAVFQAVATGENGDIGLAKRRKCGVKCRNGCEVVDLRGGFWRLRIGFGGLEVVLIGLFISKMVVRIVKTEFSCFVFFIFPGWFAGIHL